MITAARLRRLLSYSKASGRLVWRTNVGARARAGAVAGSIDRHGYVTIGIEGERYLASRLAVLHVTGSWPKQEVTYRDGNRTNLRWRNLRQATRFQIRAGLGLRSNNKTGCVGVSMTKHGRYRAHFARKHVGNFETIAEATAARARAAAA
jgi:hypothetical protein